MDFEETWRSSVRYRHASREVEVLLRALHDALTSGDDEERITRSLRDLLEFLASDEGRTDANCATVHYFVEHSEPLWEGLAGELRAIFDDMSGTLHDSIYAPQIARTFDSTPEQLLERIRALTR